MTPPGPPAVDRRLARRIDRMGVRAHAFHRWAHHPLCEEYAGERVRIGRTHLCRGCLFVGVGAVSGLAVGIAAPLPSVVVVLALPLLTCLGTAALLRSMTRERRPAAAGPHTIPGPRPKIATRLAPATIVVLASVLALRTGGVGGALAGAVHVAAVVVAGRRYRRLGPQRRPCLSCPEAGRDTACRGYAPIARRERAFSRLAARWLAPARAR